MLGYDYKHSYRKPDSLINSTEIEIRREYAKEIETKIREYQPEFRLRTEHVASILTVPLSMLGPGGRLSGRTFTVEGREIRGAAGFRLYDRLEVIWSFVKYFLKKRTKIEYAASEAFMLQLGAHEFGPSADNKKTRIITPDQSERKKCLSRDGNACRVTTAAYPDVCHIMPFRFNNNRANAERTASLFSATDILFERNFFGKYFLLLANSSILGGSDQVWNLVCLHPQLHTWWRKGYLAFKCLGIEPVESEGEEDESKMTLQLHWMPRLTVQFGQEMRLDGQDNGYAQMIQEVQAFHQSGHLSAFSTRMIKFTLSTDEMVMSGHVFSLNMRAEEAEEADMFKDMIDLQWACYKIFALSGAVGSPEILDDDPDDRTTQWVHDQARWYSMLEPVAD
ncbi:hypothetical protein ACHAPJ_005171 [Fusarium lateritium]